MPFRVGLSARDAHEKYTEKYKSVQCSQKLSRTKFTGADGYKKFLKEIERSGGVFNENARIRMTARKVYAKCGIEKADDFDYAGRETKFATSVTQFIADFNKKYAATYGADFGERLFAKLGESDFEENKNYLTVGKLHRLDDAIEQLVDEMRAAKERDCDAIIAAAAQDSGKQESEVRALLNEVWKGERSPLTRANFDRLRTHLSASGCALSSASEAAFFELIKLRECCEVSSAAMERKAETILATANDKSFGFPKIQSDLTNAVYDAQSRMETLRHAVLSGGLLTREQRIDAYVGLQSSYADLFERRQDVLAQIRKASNLQADYQFGKAGQLADLEKELSNCLSQLSTLAQSVKPPESMFENEESPFAGAPFAALNLIGAERRLLDAELEEYFNEAYEENSLDTHLNDAQDALDFLEAASRSLYRRDDSDAVDIPTIVKDFKDARHRCAALNEKRDDSGLPEKDFRSELSGVLKDAISLLDEAICTVAPRNMKAVALYGPQAAPQSLMHELRRARDQAALHLDKISLLRGAY